jgi:hypothetical protein
MTGPPADACVRLVIELRLTIVLAPSSDDAAPPSEPAGEDLDLHALIAAGCLPA